MVGQEKKVVAQRKKPVLKKGIEKTRVIVGRNRGRILARVDQAAVGRCRVLKGDASTERRSSSREKVPHNSDVKNADEKKQSARKTVLPNLEVKNADEKKQLVRKTAVPIKRPNVAAQSKERTFHRTKSARYITRSDSVFRVLRNGKRPRLHDSLLAGIDFDSPRKRPKQSHRKVSNKHCDIVIKEESLDDEIVFKHEPIDEEISFNSFDCDNSNDRNKPDNESESSFTKGSSNVKNEPAEVDEQLCKSITTKISALIKYGKLTASAVKQRYPGRVSKVKSSYTAAGHTRHAIADELRSAVKESIIKDYCLQQQTSCEEAKDQTTKRLNVEDCNDARTVPNCDIDSLDMLKKNHDVQFDVSSKTNGVLPCDPVMTCDTIEDKSNKENSYLEFDNTKAEEKTDAVVAFASTQLASLSNNKGDDAVCTEGEIASSSQMQPDIENVQLKQEVDYEVTTDTNAEDSVPSYVDKVSTEIVSNSIECSNNQTSVNDTESKIENMESSMSETSIPNIEGNVNTNELESKEYREKGDRETVSCDTIETVLNSSRTEPVEKQIESEHACMSEDLNSFGKSTSVSCEQESEKTSDTQVSEIEQTKQKCLSLAEYLKQDEICEKGKAAQKEEAENQDKENKTEEASVCSEQESIVTADKITHEGLMNVDNNLSISESSLQEAQDEDSTNVKPLSTIETTPAGTEVAHGASVVKVEECSNVSQSNGGISEVPNCVKEEMVVEPHSETDVSKEDSGGEKTDCNSAPSADVKPKEDSDRTLAVVDFACGENKGIESSKVNSLEIDKSDQDACKAEDPGLESDSDKVSNCHHADQPAGCEDIKISGDEVLDSNLDAAVVPLVNDASEVVQKPLLGCVPKLQTSASDSDTSKVKESQPELTENGVVVKATSEEDQSTKESILGALGLQSSWAVGKVACSSGTLKTIIKVPRPTDKLSTLPYRVVFKRSKSQNASQKQGTRSKTFKKGFVKRSMAGGKLCLVCKKPSKSSSCCKSCKAEAAQNADESKKDEAPVPGTLEGEANKPLDSETNQCVPTEGNSIVPPEKADESGQTLSTSTTPVKTSTPTLNLVIPEKSASFSIHPERMCSDVCKYCYGKFGSLDTPLHVAQLKTEEKQKFALSLEGLSIDSCLCDACFRFLDRKATCPTYQPYRKHHSNRPQIKSLCCVQGCSLPAHHSVRRKWLFKLKRSLVKKVPIEMDKLPPHLHAPFCSKHYYWIDFYMVCGICKRRLSRNHMYSLGDEVHELNTVLMDDGIPVCLNEKLFLCKLCRYYGSLRMKYRDTSKLGSSHKSFFESYRRRVLHYLDVEPMDEAEASTSIPMPKIKQKKSKTSTAEEKPPEASGSAKKEPPSGSKSSGMPLKIKSLLKKNTDPSDQRKDMKPPTKIRLKLGNVNIGQLGNFSILPNARPIANSGSCSASEVTPGGSELGKPVLTGEEDLALNANFVFHERKEPNNQEWEKCTATIQFDKKTKKLWQQLHQPYGNHSSFIRHLVLLEKYWRDGDLVLAPDASSRSVAYVSSVQNRIKAYDGKPAPRPSAAASTSQGGEEKRVSVVRPTQIPAATVCQSVIPSPVIHAAYSLDATSMFTAPVFQVASPVTLHFEKSNARDLPQQPNSFVPLISNVRSLATEGITWDQDVNIKSQPVTSPCIINDQNVDNTISIEQLHVPKAAPIVLEGQFAHRDLVPQYSVSNVSLPL